ncbi:MAG: hypothetical protein ACR2RV_20670 [Verrucomicrobiales bacterium]
MIYEGSEFFTVTPFDWVVNVKIDEVSGLVDNLVEVFKDGSDVSGGLLQGEAEIGVGTVPSLDAVRSPVDGSNAGGRTRVIDTLESIGDASGVFSGGIGDRVRITSTSDLQFELEYNGPESSVETEAVICLMPIQLSVIRGDAVVAGQEARATYRYYFEVDGDEVFSGAMSLTESGGGVDLSAPDGDLRLDGVYFSDDTYDTFGFNFPAITYQVPMGIFEPGDPLEARLRFETTIEAPDSNWGAYAGPSSSTGSPNMLIPIAVPEPQVAGFLLAGLMVTLLRRSRA